MEIQTKHRLKILNSKCEYVCAVDNLSKKLDYGDDIDCCLNKLFLASKLINRLECYSFPIELNILNANSEFIIVLAGDQIPLLNQIDGLNIQLYINETVYTITSDGTSTALELVINKLTELGVLVYYSTLLKNTISLTLTCDVLNVSFSIKYSDNPLVDYLFTNTYVGVCASSTITTFENCIAESDLREMYAVLDNLLS